MSEQAVVSMDVVKALMAEQAAENARNLAEVIKALKQPTVLEQAKLDKAAADLAVEQENRAKVAKGALEEINNKRNLQQWCTHEHKNGDSRCVYVAERSGPGYLICQKNQCKIRPGKASPNYKGSDIYDTKEFNRIFQKVNTGNGMFE